MSKIPLSVFIIAQNEEDRITPIINAVKNIADEILVIDSGSIDKTREVANNLGAKVIYNKWSGYGPQKVFGENCCKNDWILNIDADEEVSPELALEIQNLFLNQKQNGGQNEFYGYRIKIVNKFFNEKKPKKLAYFYNQLRLYDRNFAGFKNSTIHDSVILINPEKNKIGQLKNIIYHQSFRSYGHWIEKLNSYSSAQALEAFEKGKNPSILKIFFIPAFAFLKAYLIRRYFIYGIDGIFYSYVFSFSRLAKLIKTRELFRIRKK